MRRAPVSAPSGAAQAPSGGLQVPSSATVGVSASASSSAADRLATARSALARAEQLTGVSTAASLEVERAVTAALDAAQSASSARPTSAGWFAPLPAQQAAPSAVQPAVLPTVPGGVLGSSALAPLPVLGSAAPVVDPVEGAAPSEGESATAGADPWLGVSAASRGALVLTGSLGALLAAAARRQGPHGWCAVVGCEDLGWCAAEETGMALSRVLAVAAADLGPGSLLAVCGALLDGVDVLLIAPRLVASLRPRDRRTLLARARERGALILVPVPWEGARALEAGLVEVEEELPVRREGAGTSGPVKVSERSENLAEVVPLHPRRLVHPVAPAVVPAREMPAGRIRRLVWSLADPSRPGSSSHLEHDADGARALPLQPALPPQSSPSALPPTAPTLLTAAPVLPPAAQAPSPPRPDHRAALVLVEPT